MEFLSNYWLLIMTSLLVSGVFLCLFFKIIKTDNRRTMWTKTARIGDLCNVSTVGDNHLDNVEIIEMDDDYVTVKVKVRKRWIYPPKN